MTLVGLDWNATRLRAVLGKAGDFALPFPLEKSVAGDALGRRTGSLDASRWLQQSSSSQSPRSVLFAEPQPSSRIGGELVVEPQTFPAKDAALAVWTKLADPSARGPDDLDVARLPRPASTGLLRTLAGQVRVKVAGSLASPLAGEASLSAYADQFWSRSVLVIDIDDFALSLGFLRAVAEQAHAVRTVLHSADGFSSLAETTTRLRGGPLRVWQTRRDPRDNPVTDQSLL